MDFLKRLGQKGGTIYQLGKKGLDTFVGLGQKARGFVNSDIVQGGLSFLPPQLQVPIRAGLAIGERVLSGAENLQNRLNQGEQMYRNVKEQYEKTFKKPTSIELPKPNERRKDIEDMAEASRYDPRIPLIRGNRPR